MLEVVCRQVRLVHEQHVAPAKYTAITVVETIDGRVVLIVAADGCELEHALAGDR